MRLFLDECIDWRLSREFTDHTVGTARDMGWTSIKNGQLLALASQEFDVLLWSMAIFDFNKTWI
jgi:hypothetical protein